MVRIKDIDDISHYAPSLRQQVRCVTSKGVTRTYQVMLALGSMRSEVQLAAFLISLSQRLCALGYSSTGLIMRMSREDIGNHLRLTLETVSRLFSCFARDGLIRVSPCDIKILDRQALEERAGHQHA